MSLLFEPSTSLEAHKMLLNTKMMLMSICAG